MKKSTQALILLSMLLGTNIAQAAVSPASFMPAKPAIYFQADTNQNHFLKGELQALVQKIIDQKDTTTVASELLAKTIDHTVLGFSQSEHLTNHSEIFLLAFSMDESEFNSVISQTKDPSLTTETVGLGQKLYTSDSDFFFTYKNGNVVAANQKDLISDIILSNNQNTLLNNSDYQQTLSKLGQPNLIQAYIDLEQTLKKDSEELNLLKNPLTFVKFEGLSANQTNQGIEGKVYLTIDPTSTYQPSKFEFTPSLYQSISANNLLLFQETNNLTEQFKSTIQPLLENADIAQEFNTLSDEIQTNADLSLADLALLFQNRTAIAIHSDFANQYFPGLSLITETKGQTQSAQTFISKVQAAINKIPEQAYQQKVDLKNYYEKYYPTEENPYKNLPAKEDFLKQAITVKDLSANQYTLKQYEISASLLNGEETKVDPKKSISISIGLNNNGYLLITTLKDPSSLFSNNGLNENSNFKNSFSNQKVTNLSFINFKNIQSYFNNLVPVISAPEEVSKGVNEFLSALTSMTSYNTVDNTNNILSSFKLDMNVTKLAALSDLIKNNLDSFLSQSSSAMDNFELEEDSDLDYNDVKKSDWFYDSIKTITNYEIMSGFSNGSFKPNQPITRAEFVKTLISTLDYLPSLYTDLDLSQYTSENTKGLNIFKDVPETSWFAPYINEAYQLKLVTGYNDKTFHPNQPITRAEAMQIIYQVKGLLSESSEAGYTFNDVHVNDWFFHAVYAGKANKLVEGKNATQFKPNDLLTRAETAKIMTKIMDLQ